MNPKSVLQELIGGFGDLLEFARDTLSDGAVRKAIITDLGGTPSATSTAPSYPPAGLQSVKAYRDAAEPDLQALFSAIQDVRTCINALRSFVEALDLGPDAAVDEAYRALLDILAWNYIRLRKPRLFFIMQALSFVEEFTSVYAGEFNGPVAPFLLLGRLFETLFNPCGWFEQTNFDDENGVRRISDRVSLGGAVGVMATGAADEVLYGWDLVPGVPGSDNPTAADRALARTLTLKFADADQGAATLEKNLLISLSFLPRTQGGPGLFVSLGGGYSVDTEIRKPWYFSYGMQAAGAVSVLISKARKFEIQAPDEGSDFRASMAIEMRPNPVSGKAFDFSLMKGMSLSAGLLRLELSLSKQAATIKAGALGGVLSIGPDLFDGFLGPLIPKNGLRLDFDAVAGLGSDRGRILEGKVRSMGESGASPLAKSSTPLAKSGPAAVPPPLPPLPPAQSTGPGFSFRIPIGKALGPLTVHDLQLRLGMEGTGEDRAYQLDAASSLSVKLGPVLARADRLGLRLAVKFPSDPDQANLGFCDLDVGVLPPNGVALAIDAKGVVSGGGFLFHDRAQELYAGVMQLSVHERITVKAFGLIATRMPDGRKGYSLLVFITAEDFKPIPIGMGCTLQGIGGMVAIHRTFSETAMREGLKNNTLGTLLFPKDPIRNAPEILRNLVTAFPAKQGSYLFGILVKIGWFSPTLVTLDLALIFEFGARKRLIALGRVQSLLPSRDNALIKLNLDALGLIDFDEGKAEIDAVLVDSRLAHKFVLTGAMALRVRWTAGPGAGFALAVGGLNPHFAPPVGFPKLDRIAVALSSGDNPRLTCAAYFAITSNTIQFGARAQLYAAAIGFSVEGDVGFDVLVQLAPFHFLADFHASLQLKRGSRNLFKVSVAGALEGPRPLRVSGKASFEILWCDFTVRFDKTLVEGHRPPLPPAVNVLAELERALGDAQSWTTQRDAQRQHGVALRKLPPTSALVLDPLGTLTVKQQVVPLNTTRDIETFGGAPVAGARRFQVGATIGDQTAQTTGVVKDLFAPAQFFDMSDDEKLASPSFEEMQAGITFGSDAVSFDEAGMVASPLEFETIVIDAAGQSSRPKGTRYTLSAQRLSEHVRQSAVAKAPVRATGFARFRNAEAPQVASVQRVRWVVASITDTATRAEGVSADAGWSEKRARLAELNRVATRWQLVPEHET
jgi:hypothetical protein